MPSPISRAVRLGALAALACAAYFSLRMAFADHLFQDGTAAGAGRAFALEPDNAAYALRAGQAARAAALQPRLAEAWIELGLASERSGPLEQAGGYFERATAVDATYTPVWTLANFYARRHDNARFLAAAKRALRIGDPRYYDPAALFHLAWSVSPDPAVSGRGTAARPAAIARLASAAGLLRPLARGGDVDRAVHFWNAFIARTAPGRPLLEPRAGVVFTNGDFAWDPVPHGFDWRVPDISRVTLFRLGPPGGMRISFDGHQAERCQMLEQLITVIALTRYRLQFRYRTEAIAQGAGPRWRILDAATGQEIRTDAVPLASPVDADAVVHFAMPAGVRLALLALVYERVPGTARIAGTLELQRVRLDRDP